MKLDIDGIYIVHHKLLQKRKRLLQEKFDKLNIDNDINWIENFSPEEIKHIRCYIHDSALSNAGKRILPASLSNYMKQEKILQIQKDGGLEFVLIHEDDVLITDNYVNIINSSMKEFREMDYDLLMIGSCCNLFVSPHDIQKDKQVYYKPEYRTRCLHAYVVNIKCVRYY